MSIGKKLQTIAENEQKVYEAGFAAGQATGGDTDAAYQEGFNAGKQVEYDAFWDAFQDNGNRTDYQYAFAGTTWTTANFKPKYDIKPTRADYMFAALDSTNFSDLREALKAAGVVLDTSRCTSFSYFTRYASPRYFPELDTRSASTLGQMFVNSSVTEIDKLIFKEDGSQTVLNMFSLCSGLINIKEIEGAIGKSMNLSGSPRLTRQTIENVTNALLSTTTGNVLQLSATAVNSAFETSAGAANGRTSAEWLALVASKPNWTITLV